MSKEWFDSIPDSVVIPDNIPWGGSRIVDNDETIIHLDMRQLLLALQTNKELYNNPTAANLERIAKETVQTHIKSEMQDALHYIKHALPLFLKAELKKEKSKNDS